MNKWLLFLSLCISTQIHAQWQGKVYKPFDSLVISKNGKPMRYPTLGGLNTLMLSKADLNNDALDDIVIYDHIQDDVYTFITKKNGADLEYFYEPKYEANFPQIIYYLLLKDYNCDGIPDLFHRGGSGVGVSKGYYDNNELKFTFYKDLYFPGTFGPVNAYVQPNDIPVIEDIDNDGDIDVLAFDVLGTYMSMYKNMRVENGLPCDSIQIINNSACWGGVVQSSFGRTYALNVSCKGNTGSSTGSVIIDEGTQVTIDELDADEATINNNNSIGYKKATRHAGNCLLMMDEDADGVNDLFSGTIGYNDIQFLHNGGTNANALITWQDTTYKSAYNPMYCPQFPALSYADMDGDGKKDILLSPHQEKSNTQFFTNNKLYWYKDISSNNAKYFVLQSKDYIYDEMIDIGLNSYPTFFDWDKDGKKDLFVGGSGVFDSSTFKLTGMVQYYKNTSTPGKRSFELVSDNFLNLENKKYNGLYPHFADVTGDGITDLIMGNDKGQIILYKNTASSNNVPPVLVWETDSFANINVTAGYAAPCAMDVNFDGKEDLVVGNVNGYLYYYEDQSTTLGVKNYTFLTASLGNLNVGALGYASPIYTELDSTGKKYLLIGNRVGRLLRYDSLQTNIYGPYIKIDTMYSSIQTKGRSVPAIADIDGDGALDMILGNKMGGVKMLEQNLLIKNDTSNNGPDGIATYNNKSIEIYPNPTNNILNIKIDANQQLQHILKIYDMQGALVYKTFLLKQNIQSIDISSLQDGVYVYKISSSKNFKVGKLHKITH
jgi:hypothetical protein